MDALQIAAAIENSRRASQFSTSGTLEKVSPHLEVEGVGPIELPLRPKAARELKAACRIAPYGKGTKTLVDKAVRNTLELTPAKLSLAEDWNRAMAELTEEVAQGLGLPAERLEAKLYKLLVYEKGGFFLPHRDSEKRKGMVASLIVDLPSPFGGGELIVTHGSERRTFRFEDAAQGKGASYVAFYADCQHEVRPVTRGVRVSLAYNLVLKTKRRSKKSATSAEKNASETEQLAEAIRGFVISRPAEPLIFALEHHYTQQGLKRDLLKGADRGLCQLVEAAAEKSDCRIQFAQISRHLCQFADDGSFGRGWRNYSRSGPVAIKDLDLGEVYEDNCVGENWRDAQGKKLPLGSLSFDPSAVISPRPIDQWKPTREDYEGYTGNAGNTLDRWYHKSALVLWHNDHHFDLIVRSGIREGIKLYQTLVGKLEKTPKKRQEQARRDCRRLARAIIAHWPERLLSWYRREISDTSASLDDFAQSLLKSQEADLFALWLSTLSTRDKILRLDKFVLSACRQFEEQALAQSLVDLLDTPAPRWDDGLAFRDAQWLSAVCTDKKQAGLSPELLHRLCEIAVKRFGERSPAKRFGRAETSTAISSLPRVLKACLATEAEDALTKLLETVRSHPQEFPLEQAQVPCLKDVLTWCQKRKRSVPHPITKWLEQVRSELEALTAEKPTPPADWARAAEVVCGCRYCRELNDFLADPDSEVTRIAAREDLRDHVVESIRKHRCDATHRVEKSGTPYKLVLTKTNASYQTREKDYQIHRKLLQSLPSGR